MMRGVTATVAAILLVSLVLNLAIATGGAVDERERLTTTYQFQSLRLLKDVLSSRLWLLGEGIDPALNLFDVNDERNVAQPLLQVPAAGALVPFRSPAPAFSRNILITIDLSNIPIQTEPHIAVDPNNPDHLLVGVIDYNFAGVSAYVSLDGGETWEGPIQLKYLEKDLGSGGDPIVGFDREGNAYFTSISIGIEEFVVSGLVGSELISRIILSKSEDGGFTWSEPTSVASSYITSRTKGIGPDGRPRLEYTFAFLDKPWMSIGPDKDDPSKDAIYITFTEFAIKWETFYVGELVFFGSPVIETTIKLVKVADGGKKIYPPVSVSPTVKRFFGPNVSKQIVQGSQSAVADDGTVYVAWLDSLADGSMEGQAAIMVSRSDDGGRTWTKPKAVAYFKETSFTPRNANFRYWSSSFPQIAVGKDGEVYIVFVAKPADKQFDDGDVYFVKSTDKGETWSRPKRLNDDETYRLQFFPAMTVDPKGVIHVMWGDMRDDPSEIKYHIYYTRSEDGGETWGFEVKELGQRFGSSRVSDAYSNPNFGFPAGRFIGDYFSIAASDEDVYLTWADTRMGEFVGLNQKIAFARLRPIESPVISITPTSGASGKDVTIMGENFQPESNVFIEVGGSVVSFTRTDETGRFETRLFMPVSGEGPLTVRAYDQSGNVASVSFYVEYGFDSLRSALDEINVEVGAMKETINEISAPVRATVNLTEITEAVKGALKVNKSEELSFLSVIVLLVVAVAASSAVTYLTVRRVKK